MALMVAVGDVSLLLNAGLQPLEVEKAHGTFVCGKNCGGVAEAFNCDGDVDICDGTLSKAAGCQGEFIICRYHFRILENQKILKTCLILFSNSCFLLNIWYPNRILLYYTAAVDVARKEVWIRWKIWKMVKEFQVLTGNSNSQSYNLSDFRQGKESPGS
ncbi:hypothetical protein SAY86_017070 [Trapa natans]|uniref:Uncharacterized protein n=1 Tax=Trapa natans TaxID=22666 RepID=A0AAN7R721_TRANT|nr:hypothetical protein SAY86_017070 [Trapa natans]